MDKKVHITSTLLVHIEGIVTKIQELRKTLKLSQTHTGTVTGKQERKEYNHSEDRALLREPINRNHWKQANRYLGT
jgi:hypothetical protein